MYLINDQAVSNPSATPSRSDFLGGRGAPDHQTRVLSEIQYSVNSKSYKKKKKLKNKTTIMPHYKRCALPKNCPIKASYSIQPTCLNAYKRLIRCRFINITHRTNTRNVNVRRRILDIEETRR